LIIEAAPAVDPSLGRVEDPRVRFYLDNHKIIETWASLRADAVAALQDLILDLVPVLGADAVHHDEPDLFVRADDSDARRPRIVMSRRHWQDTSGQVPAAVVIEWNNPIIDKDGEVHFYVGVRVWRQGRRGVRVASRLSELAPGLCSQLGKPWAREAESFPVWRWIEPDGDRLDEIALLDQARAAAWQCWAVAAPHIESLTTTDQ